MFLLVLGLTFKYLKHFKSIFVYREVRVYLPSFEGGCPVFAVSFVEETVFSPLCSLGTLVENNLAIHTVVYFWTFLCSTGLYIYLYASKPTI